MASLLLLAPEATEADAQQRRAEKRANLSRQRRFRAPWCAPHALCWHFMPRWTRLCVQRNRKGHLSIPICVLAAGQIGSVSLLIMVRLTSVIKYDERMTNANPPHQDQLESNKRIGFFPSCIPNSLFQTYIYSSDCKLLHCNKQESNSLELATLRDSNCCNVR